ncbi:hypothetical protein ACFQ9Z_35060 [Streptomyces sp. NPDC056580]
MLLQRTLRGKFTIPEAAVLADYIYAGRHNADQTELIVRMPRGSTNN